MIDGDEVHITTGADGEVAPAVCGATDNAHAINWRRAVRYYALGELGRHVDCLACCSSLREAALRDALGVALTAAIGSADRGHPRALGQILDAIGKVQR